MFQIYYIYELYKPFVYLSLIYTYLVCLLFIVFVTAISQSLVHSAQMELFFLIA